MESSARRFEDRWAAEAWLTATFEPWLAALSEAERQAISAYKLDAYEPINEALRLGYEIVEDQIVEDLDSALSRFRLPEPVIVYRGFFDPVVYEAQVGRDIVDFGYFSTSLLRIVAEDIVASVPEDERLIATVLIPGGANVGAFVGAPDLVRDWGEVEILLPRESRFRITGRSDPENIDLEVIIR